MSHVRGCTACFGLLQFTDNRHDDYPWANLWTCPTCVKRFYCCDNSCGSQTVAAYGTPAQLKRHNYRFHKKPRLAASVDADDITDTACDPPDDDQVPLHIIPNDAFRIFTSNPSTQRFFADIRSFSFHVAVQGLVARACYQDASLHAAAYPPLSEEDIALFVRIAKLVFQTGSKQQHLLAEVLTGFEKRFSSAGVGSRSMVMTGLPLPTTHKGFLSTLLNPTNRNSLTSILPRPPILELGSRHAYVSIPSVLAYELGLADAAVDPAYNSKFERLVNSQHGQELFTRARDKLIAEGPTIECMVNDYSPYVVLLLMWFDGWDPNGSSKGNRSPVWSGTLTMVMVDMPGRVIAVASYPFAAGPGKADHDIVFRKVLGDVQALQAPLGDATSRRWYYRRAAQHMALVYAELFCIWEDQPARRQETNTLGGNSNNHSIFGKSCFAINLRTPIPACDGCRSATNSYLAAGNFHSPLLPACSLCTNWQFPDDPLTSLYLSPISDKFPEDAVAGKHFNIGGGNIDSDLLIQAWREACDAVITGRWADTQVQQYLKTLLVNEATIKALLYQCNNYMLWTAIGSDPDSYDAATKATCRRLYATNPERFTVPGPPAAWLLSSLSLHVETIMHLAGGVQKAVAKFVHRYATSLNHGPALTTRLAFLIALVHKYCRVQYLPLAAYNTDKFGGWVMENFKSLCKLAPWLYRCFEDDALQPPAPYVMPTTPYSTWIREKNIGYLRSRGVAGTAKLLAPAAKRAVKELFTQTGGPPPAVVHPASSVTPRDMRRLWLSCSTMFKDLMRVDHDAATINRTYARVRAFLSNIEALDAALKPERAKPLFLAKYNFPSLLRAADHLEKFGNVRDLHEGGIEGEAMVKRLRPLVPNGLKERFATHLLTKAFRDYTLERVMINLGRPTERAPNEYTDSGVQVIDDSSSDSDSASTDSEDEAEIETEDLLASVALDEGPDPYKDRRHVLEAPDDTTDDDINPSNSIDTDAPSPLLFRRYSSRAIVEQYLVMGVPISVVITDQKGKQRIGVVVAKCNEWWLLPLKIDELRFDDPLGFSYFQISLHGVEEMRQVKTKAIGQVPSYLMRLLNYGSLLPALWLEAPIPYAFVTKEGEHLNAEFKVL